MEELKIVGKEAVRKLKGSAVFEVTPDSKKDEIVEIEVHPDVHLAHILVPVSSITIFIHK